MNKLTRLTLAAAACTMQVSLIAQSTQTGLGTVGHLNGGAATNYYVGWDAASNIPLNLEHRGTEDINFLTGGTQRMTIKGTSYLYPGYIGVNIATPTAYMHISNGAFANYLQLTNASTGTLVGDGFAMQLLFNHVILTHRANGDVYLNTGTGLSNATRMTIVGTTGANLGFVGIGPAFVNPNNMLDVDQGDIDVNTATRGYMINDQYVLRHGGTLSNILVGINAGSSITGALDCSFVGTNAGASVTTGFRNTIMGSSAGADLTTGANNCFYGFHAGENDITGACNTFMGSNAGANSDAPFNTFAGFSAGVSNTTGFRNTFLATGQASIIQPEIIIHTLATEREMRM